MKTFIVTGASRGIGYFTTLALLKNNHRVVAIARSHDKLKKLEIEADTPNIITITADLTNADDISRIEKTVASFGKISGLVNNAGMVINKSFLETTKAEWLSVFDANLFSAVDLIKSLLPHFDSHSHIVNVSSMGGFQGSAKFPGLAAYSTAKGALAILTECLSAELAPSNIFVNCLCLGAVQTEMLAEAFPGYEAPVRPEQMATYICNFVSTAHQFFNGKIIPVALNNPE
ncbi:MAG: SDR family oxidoreductase [Balneolaceae bacterium]